MSRTKFALKLNKEDKMEKEKGVNGNGMETMELKSK